MNEINRYFHKIEKGLTCPGKTKAEFMNEFKDSVYEYLSEHKDAGLNDIRNEFGTEEDIIAGFDFNGKAGANVSFFRKLIVSAVCTALAIWFAFAVVSTIDVHNEAHGYFEEGFTSSSEAAT